ncbi:MAG: hypothetical protein HFI67_10860 [Lachnospiraceae bacterium]|nr:hypothetical protein [Lachnospiraceae bacterium]
MSVLMNTEVDKLSVMYEGDKNRDATDKIRGFLFQDYVAIMCLLQNQVKYVCSEYLEDVDIFFEDGTFEFIQVKYYPKTYPNMKEISTDLYYQYLRLQMLRSTLKAKPSLYIHRNSKVEKPAFDKMKEYIELGNALPKSVPYPDVADSAAWLKTKVYTTNKKELQKKTLFVDMASEDSLKEFVSKYDIFFQVDIKRYKKELMEALARAYPNPDKDGNDEHWQFILLGLAISYIQRRYTLVNPVFDQLRVDKKEFDRYMTESAKTKTEQTIASYLAGIVCEKYGEIINSNDLSDIQTHMLNMICQNTVRWINEIGKTVDGQYQLLNTYSMDDVGKIAGYRGAPVDDRLLYVAECKQGFLVFLEYLWKIMLNICQKKANNEPRNSARLEMFDPLYYVDSSVTDYVCLNFPEDKYVNHSVILPRAGGNFKGVKRKIVERIVNMLTKPEKWFFENSKLTRGKNYYNYSTANVNENPTVADLGEDSFYIECMDCIGIDEDEWGIQEDCNSCIFSMKCVKEEA